MKAWLFGSILCTCVLHAYLRSGQLRAHAAQHTAAATKVHRTQKIASGAKILFRLDFVVTPMLAKALLALGIAVLIGIGGTVTFNYHMFLFIWRLASTGITPDTPREYLGRLAEALPKSNDYRYVVLAIQGVTQCLPTTHEHRNQSQYLCM